MPYVQVESAVATLRCIAMTEYAQQTMSWTFDRGRHALKPLSILQRREDGCKQLNTQTTIYSDILIL